MGVVRFVVPIIRARPVRVQIGAPPALVPEMMKFGSPIDGHEHGQSTWRYDGGEHVALEQISLVPQTTGPHAHG
eukprot:6696760-Pyramimonas_sp.AAC.1